MALAVTDAIVEKIVQETVVKDEKLTRESFVKVKTAAQQFLDVYNNISLYQNKSRYNRIEKRKKFNNILIKLEKFLKVLYEEVYGREYYYIYVKEDSNGKLFSYKLSLSQLIDYLSISIENGKLIAKQARTALIDAEGNKEWFTNEDFITSNSIDEERKLNQDHVKVIQTVYNHSKNRLSQGKSKKLMFRPTSSFDNFNNRKKWYVTTTINMGYLKEAYFNALMREHESDLDYLCKIQIRSDNDYLQTYGSEEEMAVFYKYYIQELDNVSFGLTGDVQATKKINGEDRYFSYAVKGLNFSFGSIEPIAKIAKNIANNMIGQNKKEILRQLISKSKTDIHQSIYLYAIDKSKKQILNTVNKVDKNHSFAKLLVAQGAELTSLQ